MTKYQVIEIPYRRDRIQITPLFPVCESREKARKLLATLFLRKFVDGQTSPQSQGGDVYSSSDKQWRILEITDLRIRHSKPRDKAGHGSRNSRKRLKPMAHIYEVSRHKAG